MEKSVSRSQPDRPHVTNIGPARPTATAPLRQGRSAGSQALPFNVSLAANSTASKQARAARRNVVTTCARSQNLVAAKTDPFYVAETHGILLRPQNHYHARSDELGWAALYDSPPRERRYW